MTAPRLTATTAVVDGLTVYMETGGAATGVPIILVHGAAVSGRYMLPTARRLAARHRVIVPDLPGYGASDAPPAPLHVPGLADAVARLLDTLGIECAHLLGNSLGAQVVASLAARRPDRVASAVLVGPTVDRAARTRRQQLMRLALDATRERPSLIPLHLADIARTGLRTAVASLDAALDDRIEDALAGVSTPVLIVCGTRDPLAPPAWCESLAAASPMATLACIAGPHALNYSRPQALADRVERWLTELAPAECPTPRRSGAR